jgi:hypothetical protein
VVAGVDGRDEGAGEAVFGTEEDSDGFHRAGSLGGYWVEADCEHPY